MSKQSKLAHLAAVKTALADKYERLAKSSSSRPRAVTLMRNSKKYRRAAEVATQLATQLAR
jgi:hypothetical protein